MGTPLPPNKPSTGCALCFGVNGPLGLVQPEYVIVSISGCVAGGKINEQGARLSNGRFWLTHVSGCAYRLNTPDYQVTLDWADTRTRVFFILLGIEPQSFISDVGVLCATEIEGNSISYWSKASQLGVARVTWPLEGLE